MSTTNPLPAPGSKAVDTASPRVEGLTDAIRDLESAALEPVVEGEIHLWCERVTPSIQSVIEAWASEAKQREALRRAVEVTDPATTHRGDDLCEEERRIDEQLRRIRSRLEDVARTSAPGRPRGVDEATRIGDARTTRAAILHWSVDARMLITDLAQWLTEAHYRDRGTPGG